MARAWMPPRVSLRSPGLQSVPGAGPRFRSIRAAGFAAPDRDDLRQNRNRDLVRRDGAEIETGGRFQLHQTFGSDAACRERGFQRLGLLAAADEGYVIDVDGE